MDGPSSEAQKPRRLSRTSEFLAQIKMGSKKGNPRITRSSSVPSPARRSSSASMARHGNYSTGTNRTRIQAPRYNSNEQPGDSNVRSRSRTQIATRRCSASLASHDFLPKVSDMSFVTGRYRRHVAAIITMQRPCNQAVTLDDGPVLFSRPYSVSLSPTFTVDSDREPS